MTKHPVIFPRLLVVVLLFTFHSVAQATELRLVSLAPSLTEMVFDLDSGTHLVGVTSHCIYPPEAKKIPKIGMYQTPSVEAIMATRPDTILALTEHLPIFPLFDEIGLRYEIFDHRSLPGILDSITRLGEICGKQEKAVSMRTRLEQALAPKNITRQSPSLLFLIGRDYGQGMISNAFAVGNDNLYDNVIAAAGCRNAYEGTLAYPSLSGEGVAALRPDIIFEAVAGDMGTAIPFDELRKDWNGLAHLPAVHNNRIHYSDADYVFIPGMRLIQLKDELMPFANSAATVETP